MPVTKDQIKAEIDKVRDEDLGVLYRIVLALESAPQGIEVASPPAADPSPEEWRAFVARTYGSFADSPLERGEQGVPEVREPLL